MTDAIPHPDASSRTDRFDDGAPIAKWLVDDVLSPLKAKFVGKDLVVDLIGVGLVARENVFLYGPPGTAKSAIVNELGRRLDGRVFDYLLTRFTEPNELFGPFDIRRLREGDLVTNTDGMLPEADLVFLDELLNANSAILNALLLALNERIFRRGRETYDLPTLMVLAAGNSLPEDETLAALFDRFLVRVHVENVETEQLAEVLAAGWSLETAEATEAGGVSRGDVLTLQSLVRSVDVENVRDAYTQLVASMRRAGLIVSDRRAVRFQRLLAASAILCGRSSVEPSDFWVLRATWDSPEQQTVLTTLVDEAIKSAEATLSPDGPAHPQATADSRIDPEQIAAELDSLAGSLTGDGQSRLAARDRLAALAGRTQWIPAGPARGELDQRIESLWKRLE